MYTIEFQKRGLPHAHLLIFLHQNDKYPSADDIDKVISTEISCPIENPKLYECVKDHMIHDSCGVVNKSLLCMKNGKCSRFYPKNLRVVQLFQKMDFHNIEEETMESVWSRIMFL